METKYLDIEIERLNLLERNNELTEWGKKMLSELKEIKKVLFIPHVSQQRELLEAFSTWYNAKPKLKKGELIYVNDIIEFLKP